MTRSFAPPVSVRMPPASAGPPAAAARCPQAAARRPAGLLEAVRDAVARGEPGAGLRGNMTAGAFFRRRDHRRGRAPWPGPHPGSAGRAGGLHATGARAGPAASGNGSAALCLISLISRPSRGGRWPPARPAWPGSSGNRTDPGRRRTSPESGGRVAFRRAAIGHPKVLPARLWDSVRESGPVARPGDGLGAVSGAPRCDTNPHSSRPAAVYTRAASVRPCRRASRGRSSAR
jgi:hypothetical protein